jgi:hypothetical protein
MNFLSTYPRATTAIGAILLLVAVISLTRSCRPPATVRKDLKTIQQDMVRQAEQLAGTLESGSRVVVLELDYAIEAHGDRVYDQVIDALKARGLDVQHVKALTVDAENGWKPDTPGFPYPEFVRVAEAFPDTDAVIALCGVPYDIEEIHANRNSGRPKLLVAGGVNGGPAESLCDRGWLYAATVPRTVMENGERVLKYELLTCR